MITVCQITSLSIFKEYAHYRFIVNESAITGLDRRPRKVLYTGKLLMKKEL